MCFSCADEIVSSICKEKNEELPTNKNNELGQIVCMYVPFFVVVVVFSPPISFSIRRSVVFRKYQPQYITHTKIKTKRMV